MGTILGLDIGSKTITGAVLSGTAKKLELEDFFVEEIPDLVTMGDGPPTAEAVDLEEGLPPSIGELIKKTLAARKLTGIDTVASLDTCACIVRDRIPVPFTRDDQIEKTVIFEAENHLITFDVDDMVLEYHKVGERNGNSILILLACRDETIAERLAVLKEGGVDPVALDLDAAALFNAFAVTPTFDPERTTLLVDVGATTTKVVLIEKGRLTMVRSLRLGAYLTNQSLRQIEGPAEGGGTAAEFELPDASSIEARFDEIESTLRRLDPAGVDPLQLLGDDEPIAILTDDEYARVTERDEAAEGAVAPAAAGVAVAEEEPAPWDYQSFLDRLGLEIQRSFSTSMIGPVELICLTGGFSEREEARRYFAERFDVETIALDFGASGESFEMDLDEDERARLNRFGAVAVGLAVKELGRDRVGLDFRKKRFRYERRFEKLKFPLLCMALMCCALFLWTAFDQFVKFNAMRQEKENILARTAEYFEAFFDEPIPAGTDLVMPRVEAKRKEFNNLLGKGAEIPAFLDEIQAWREVARVFEAAKKNGLRFEVTNIKMLFELRARKSSSARRGAGASREPPVMLETPWAIDLMADEAIGEEFRTLFKSSRMWEMQVAERSRGGRTSITLTLTPKDSFLFSLGR